MHMRSDWWQENIDFHVTFEICNVLNSFLNLREKNCNLKFTWQIYQLFKCKIQNFPCNYYKSPWREKICNLGFQIVRDN